MAENPRVVSCPTCGNPVRWMSDSAWRPFCSKRCKMIDLGAWATERYRVPVVEDPDHLDNAQPDERPGRES